MKTKFLIGAGGWAYFQVPNQDSLIAYSKAFNFVEVNSTFYELPSLRAVALWRRKVPPDFEFSVRCYKGLTHKYRLEPNEESFSILERMKAVCKVLKADVLHLQTPPILEFTQPKIRSIRNFFSSSELGGLRLAWEIRQAKAEQIPKELVKLMQDLNVIHCTDLSEEEPAYKSDILYSRLFGKGAHNIYQFTDEELKEIDSKATKHEHRKIILSFHGLRMYKDAARFKIYKQTGTFPSVTKSTGLSSLKEILSEDAKFPSTKQQLIKHQGWKVIDLTQNRRIRASELMEKLPEKTYHSVEEVVKTLEAMTIET